MRILYQGKEYEPLQMVRDCDGFPIGCVIMVDGDRKVLDDDEYEYKPASEDM